MGIVNNSYSTRGAYVTEARLLTNAVAMTDGEWFEITGLVPTSFQVDGITTATLQIRGSNAPTIPANSAHGFQLGSNITSDGLFALDAAVKYVKVRITAWTSGTINCYLVGTSRR